MQPSDILRKDSEFQLQESFSEFLRFKKSFSLFYFVPPSLQGGGYFSAVGTS